MEPAAEQAFAPKRRRAKPSRVTLVTNSFADEKRFIMHIVALSGSPRKGGNTAIMVQAFKEGAEAAGNTVEVIDVGAKKIAPCRACKYCFTHGGACAIDDDMTGVREALSAADMVVFATPIYWFDISAQLKLAIDRMYAFGGCGFNFSKVALLLDSGAEGVYDAAIAAYKAMSTYLKWENMGIITIGGMNDRGDMANNPKLAEVRALGESLK